MARQPSSPPTPSADPSLPDPSTPPSSRPSRAPLNPPSQFHQEVLNVMKPLSDTDLARMGGPGVFDLGFPDPLGFFDITVEDFGKAIREHLLVLGNFRNRYSHVLSELHKSSVLQAPQHALTILSRMAAAELFVQRCAANWAPAS